MAINVTVGTEIYIETDLAYDLKINDAVPTKDNFGGLITGSGISSCVSVQDEDFTAPDENNKTVGTVKVRFTPQEPGRYNFALCLVTNGVYKQIDKVSVNVINVTTNEKLDIITNTTIKNM